ncbi:MAG: hypothetical protein QOD83_4948, partial [Solirubrobacteraceae bacterium]|nr:hypothetical protein [Solirubrobacteraceae bacterium]
LRPPATTREEAIEGSLAASKIIGSKRFPLDEERIATRAGAAFDRAFYPVGMARQILAIRASGDRTEALGAVDVPTVVIHGSVDSLVSPSGGEATAKAIPGAELLIIEGMGHDLPEGTWPIIVDAIVENAEKSGRS